MHMVWHHAELMKFQYGKIIRKMQCSLCYYSSQWRFNNSSTPWSAIRNPCIPADTAEVIEALPFLQDNVIDEGIVIVMMKRAPMIRMDAGIAERGDCLGGVHDDKIIRLLIACTFTPSHFRTFDKPASPQSAGGKGRRSSGKGRRSRFVGGAAIRLQGRHHYISP